MILRLRSNLSLLCSKPWFQKLNCIQTLFKLVTQSGCSHSPRHQSVWGRNGWKNWTGFCWAAKTHRSPATNYLHIIKTARAAVCLPWRVQRKIYIGPRLIWSQWKERNDSKWCYCHKRWVLTAGLGGKSGILQTSRQSRRPATSPRTTAFCKSLHKAPCCSTWSSTGPSTQHISSKTWTRSRAQPKTATSQACPQRSSTNKWKSLAVWCSRANYVHCRSNPTAQSRQLKV